MTGAPMKRFFIRVVEWEKEQEGLLSIRREVFIEEQQVPEEMEIDGLDEACAHVLAEDVDGNAIGTARLMPEGRIGRVAVLNSWRRCGVGAGLMANLEEEARGLGMLRLTLHSQTWTIPFYESIGYAVMEGEEFVEAGIPHRLMEKGLG